MIKENFISVVVPLYNKEKFIRRTIESILLQTYSNFELLIVDDGSTDNSVDIVRSFSDKRIHIISKTNGGVSDARNEGIRNSRFDYIAFIDADDEWSDIYLEEMNLLINKYPGAGAYGARYYVKNPNGTITKLGGIKREGITDYFKYSLNRSILNSSSVIIKKSVFREIGMFNTILNRGEDLEMWARIALKYDIAFTPKILTTYYIEISKRNSISPLNIKKTFSYYAEDFLKENNNRNKQSIYFKRYIYKKNMYKCYLYITLGDKKEAFNTLFPLHVSYFTLKLFWKNLVLLMLN